MSLIDRYLADPKSRWNRLCMLWTYSVWPDARDWCLRWIYAQHNARVLSDFESRMSSTVYLATGGMMSKPYYTIEAIRSQIEEHHNSLYEDAYSDGREDLAAELGVEDPRKTEA